MYKWSVDVRSRILRVRYGTCGNTSIADGRRVGFSTRPFSRLLPVIEEIGKDNGVMGLSEDLYEFVEKFGDS